MERASAASWMAFKHLKEANLKIKLSKCQIFENHLHYLVHLIWEHGIHPLSEKASAIEKLKEPSNIDKLCHFLCLTGYYRKFIPLFTNVTKPLNKPSFSGCHNAKQLLNILTKHFARNLYFSIPIWKNCTHCWLMLVILHILESWVRKVNVLRIWGP